MSQPSTAFLAKLALDQVEPIWLVEIQASTTMRYALHPIDVTFSSNTYTANSGTIGSIEENSLGGEAKLTVALQNQDRVIRDWLRGGDRRGTVVRVALVLADNLADTDGYIDWEYELDSCDWDDAQARQMLAGGFLGMTIPARRIQAFFCEFDYKSDECGVTATLEKTIKVTGCDRTYDGPNGCTKHFTAVLKLIRRFGGFPGKPQKDWSVW